MTNKDEMPDILAVIERLSFQFAHTMPHWPHEYTVRRKADDDADYVELFEAIMRDGVIEFWKGTRKRSMPGRYLFPGDGWVYWSMSAWRSTGPEGRHPLAVSRHINRCTLLERGRLRQIGLLHDGD
jgi:hypothetical protein